ncbi:MAG: hypothetical protein GF331_08090 [Chitinivibrionales bacterium]|nr:hypothetical protein [Chitinivibrionales bacterium]
MLTKLPRPDPGSLFERALRDTAITAWVAINDPCGYAALDFLHGKKVAVPDRIALIAFDDSVEAFVLGLSSYNFNVAAVVRAMIGHLLSPPGGPSARAPRLVEVAGRVVARESTGKRRWPKAGSVR